jgi:hemolysin III
MNDRFSALSHLVGATLAVVALVMLVTFAALRAGAMAVTTLSIFGSTLVLLYLTSTLYHALPEGKARGVFRVLDHCAIYLLIAGTYTPVVLLVLPAAWGWSLFGVVWGLAITAIVLRLCRVHLRGWAAIVPFLAMGWLILIALSPLSAALSARALFWLAFGGVLYSLGALLFALDVKFGRKCRFTFHDGFHVLTMLGSASHVWFLFWVVVS